MALSVEVGTFTANTGSSTTTVTTGFQGKAVILFSHGKTDLTESNEASYAFGFSDGTNDGSNSWASDNGVTTSNAGRFFHNTNMLGILSNGTPTLAGYVQSIAFNADPNMVLTWGGTPASAYEISYILFGGSDISNVFVGNSTAPLTAITKNITGVGFQGDAVFLLSNSNTVTSTAANVLSTLGFAASTSKRWSISAAMADNSSTDSGVNAVSGLWNDKCYVGISPTTGAANRIADFGGFNADGFDLDFSSVSGSADRFAYLVIKGGSWDCGVEAKPTAATTQTVSSTAFTPALLGYVLSAATATDTVTSDAIQTFGAATSTSARAYAGAYAKDIVTTNTVTKSAHSDSLIAHEMAQTANADFTSFQSDGWTITWDAAGTAFQSAWFAVGTATAGAEFDASISATASASAYLGTSARLAGTSVNAARMLMTLSGQIVLNADISGLASSTAALTTSITTEATIDGSATTAGILSTTISFAGQAIGTAEVDANLVSPGLMDSQIFGESDATAALTTSITVEVSISGTATATALELVEAGEAATFYADITGTATAVGDIVQLQASVSGVATTSADLYAAIRLAANITATATCVAILTNPWGALIVDTVDLSPMVTLDGLILEPTVSLSGVSLEPL